MLYIMKIILTGITTPAKLLNFLGKEMEEKELFSKAVAVALAIFIAVVGYTDGSFHVDNAMVNILAMILIVYVIKVFVRIIERILSVMIKYLTLIPTWIFDQCQS